MNDAALAIAYIGVFAVIGTVIAVIALAKARVSIAKTTGHNDDRYRQIAEQSNIAQQRTAEQLAQLNTRLTAVEHLLKEVG